MPEDFEEQDGSMPHEEHPDENTIATMSDAEFDAFRVNLKAFLNKGGSNAATSVTLPLDQNVPKSEDTTGSFLDSVRSAVDVLVGDPPPEIQQAPRGGGQRMRVKVKAEQQEQNRYGLQK